MRLTKRLTEMHDQLGGYGQLIGLLAIGPMAREQSKHSTELFATEVMLMMRHPGAL